ASTRSCASRSSPPTSPVPKPSATSSPRRRPPPASRRSCSTATAPPTTAKSNSSPMPLVRVAFNSKTSHMATASGQYSNRRDNRDRRDRAPRQESDGPELLRSEEHTSELQSRENLVCRLLLEKKKNKN